jgi:hypothetical protein
MVQTSLTHTQNKDAVNANKDLAKKNTTPQKKGFAAMPPEKVEAIAHKGGSARAAQLGHDGYVALGQMGGRARARQLGQKGYAAMGRKGAAARKAQAKKALQQAKQQSDTIIVSPAQSLTASSQEEALLHSNSKGISSHNRLSAPDKESKRLT